MGRTAVATNLVLLSFGAMIFHGLCVTQSPDALLHRAATLAARSGWIEVFYAGMFDNGVFQLDNGQQRDVALSIENACVAAAVAVQRARNGVERETARRLAESKIVDNAFALTAELMRLPAS